VVPILAVMGAKKAGNKFKLKNIAPVTSKVIGVINAATPTLCKIKRDDKKIYKKYGKNVNFKK
jgi:hypothetical protein